MNLRNWITGLFEPNSCIPGAGFPTHTITNPATGLPIIGGIDAPGNPFGHNLIQSHDTCSAGGYQSGGTLGPIGTFGSNPSDCWSQTTWSDFGR